MTIEQAVIATKRLHDQAQIWHQGQEDLRNAIKNVQNKKVVSRKH